MKHLVKIFFTGDTARFAIGGLSIIIALTLGGIYLSFEFLNWYESFYNALQDKNMVAFKQSLGRFSILAGASIIQYTILRYVNQLYTLKWREAITFDILGKWKGQGIEGYSQRIQEDCAKFARLFESIFVGCFNAIVSLAVFTPILLGLSSIVFPNFYGALWLICFAYTLGGLALSFFLGRKLPKLEYNNQKEEAKFRRALEFKRGNYPELFDNVKKNYLLLFKKYKIFNFFSSSFFQLSVILPYILVGNAYFTGLITLGVLVKCSKAFNRVNDSMSYLIDSWLSITELQSVIIRLNEFNKELDE